MINTIVKILNQFCHRKQKITIIDKRDLREKIDLTIHHSNCPICLKELDFHEEKKSDYYEGSYYIQTWTCKSNCYKKIYKTCYPRYRVYIFGKRFELWLNSEEEKQYLIEDKIWREIYYWTKNQRYLMKILEGDN